jgi:hypothetical protein
MKRPLVAGIAIAVAIVDAEAPAVAQNAESGGQPVRASQVEEIYIARSVHLSRIKPTEFCAEVRSGFKPDHEDQWEFRAISVSPFDGRVVDGYGKTIASGHGCQGATNDPTISNFYLELLLGKTALKGIGDCRYMKTDFPEPGLTPGNCRLILSDTLGQYVGGQLTTNTMASRKSFGPESDPPGYVQPSIATIRLWKKRL